MCQAPRALVSVLALAITSVLATGPLAPSAIAKPAGKPDLTIAHAAKGGEYTFEDKDATLQFQDVTKNVKKHGHDAAASASRTGIFLVPLHSSDRNPGRVQVGSRRVPGLGPGRSHSGKGEGTLSPGILPLGAYKVLVCADVQKRIKERNESNNCKKVGNFYVVRQVWRGSVSGVGACCGAARAEKWHSLGAHLDFGEYLGRGAFRYDFIGTVEWNDSGVNMGGCTIDGHGETALNHAPGPTLDYFAGRYQGEVNSPRSVYTYPIKLTGGGGFPCSSEVPGPVTQEVLKIQDPMVLNFDQNALAGSAGQSVAEGTTWTWDFR